MEQGYTISKLIDDLIKIKESHGDLKVCTDNKEGMTYVPLKDHNVAVVAVPKEDETGVYRYATIYRPSVETVTKILVID